MRILIEKEPQVGIVLDVSFVGFDGFSCLKWLHRDEKCDILQVTLGSLSLMSPFSDDDIPVGSVEFIRKFAELAEIKLPAPLNIPDSIKPDARKVVHAPGLVRHVQREIFTAKRKDIKEFPVFVKPLSDVKAFTGFVADNDKAFDLYPIDWDSMDLLCSEPINANILSEWRCYILGGKIVNVSNYSGDPILFPNIGTIETTIYNHTDAPAAYSMDFAVVEWGERINLTVLIECNDAWALGPYGCPPELYAKMIRNRWKEIIKNQ